MPGEDDKTKMYKIQNPNSRNGKRSNDEDTKKKKKVKGKIK